MELSLIQPLVEKIHGCTFATLDVLCEPQPGVMHEIIGQRVILFRTHGQSGYEGMIKRRLAAAGKNADSFHVGPLPWGERLDNLPIIRNGNKYYLQTIPLNDGKQRYFLSMSLRVVNPRDFGIKPSRGYDGLPPEDTVHVKTYALDSITRVTMFGEIISTAETKKRPVLSLKL